MDAPADVRFWQPRLQRRRHETSYQPHSTPPCVGCRSRGKPKPTRQPTPGVAQHISARSVPSWIWPLLGFQPMLPSGRPEAPVSPNAPVSTASMNVRPTGDSDFSTRAVSISTTLCAVFRAPIVIPRRHLNATVWDHLAHASEFLGVKGYKFLRYLTISVV